MTAATIDPASAMLTLMETLGNTGRCDATVKVFDGKRRYNLASRHAGEVELRATKYAPYVGPATECRVGFERLAGFREGRLGRRYPDEIVLYLAPLFDDAPPMRCGCMAVTCSAPCAYTWSPGAVWRKAKLKRPRRRHNLFGAIHFGEDLAGDTETRYRRRGAAIDRAL